MDPVEMESMERLFLSFCYKIGRYWFIGKTGQLFDCEIDYDENSDENSIVGSTKWRKRETGLP